MTDTAPNAFLLYTVIFLYRDDEFLLLQRAANKAFAPSRWTGVGGKVEVHEHGALGAAALRELQEETGLSETDLKTFALRRVLYHNRLGEPLTGLLYYTAQYRGETPPCNEGDLYWKISEDFAGLDIIETTAHVLPRLVEDVARDPEGLEPVKIGLAHYRIDQTLTNLSWSEVAAPQYKE